MKLVLFIIALFSSSAVFGQTQTQLNQQAHNSWLSADRQMTAQWKITYAAMKSENLERPRTADFDYAASLLESQRAWLKFRDTQCLVEAGKYLGGSMQPMVYAQCRTEMTRDRTKQLKSVLTLE